MRPPPAGSPSRSTPGSCGLCPLPSNRRRCRLRHRSLRLRVPAVVGRVPLHRLGALTAGPLGSPNHPTDPTPGSTRPEARTTNAHLPHPRTDHRHHRGLRRRCPHHRQRPQRHRRHRAPQGRGQGPGRPDGAGGAGRTRQRRAHGEGPEAVAPDQAVRCLRPGRHHHRVAHRFRGQRLPPRWARSTSRARSDASRPRPPWAT